MNQIETVALTDDEARVLRVYGSSNQVCDGPDFDELWRLRDLFVVEDGTRALTTLGKASLHVHEMNAKLAHEREGLSALAKRGWVKAKGVQPPHGTWMRCVGVEPVWKPIQPGSIVYQWELTSPRGLACSACEYWTGCPRCTREEPHDIDVDCAKIGDALPLVGANGVEPVWKPIQPGSIVRDASGREIGKVAEPPRSSVVRSSSSGEVGRTLGPAHLQINSPRRGYVTAEDIAVVRRVDAITSQEHLAKAMFVAQLWEELERRAERREVSTSPIRSWTYKCDPREVVAIMWNDPTYAKQRAECESAAERVWSSRTVFR